MEVERESFFHQAKRLQKSGYFGYLVGNTEKDLLEEIVKPGDKDNLKKCQECLLRKAIQQTTALYCRRESVPKGECCCYAHIVERPMSEWESDCEKLDEALRIRLRSPKAQNDLSPEKVLESIKAEGKRAGKPSKEWEEAFKWLTLAMTYVCDRTEMNPLYPPELPYRNVVDEVKKASGVFSKLKREKLKVKKYNLWPTQVAAILLNVYGVASGTKLLIQKKTGEGKTNVCGISAAVVAKLFNDGPAVILTSSLDRACADRKDQEDFIEEYLGRKPIFVKELKPGSTDENVPSPAGVVAYGQVSDAQRIVVDMLTQHNTKGLYEFLKTASFFLDEADHVLIEQAESLLYIASPCPSYYSLHGAFIDILHRIDYEGDFHPELVKTRSAIQRVAKKMTERVLEGIRKYEEKYGKLLPGGKLHPTIIDLKSFVAASSTGAFSARFKKNGKDYVIEVTTEDDHHGTIPHVEKITIVDVATGTESDGTRWTAEAPFCEGMEGLPIGGSDPLAFYNAFPYLLKKLRWFGGITGTIGAKHALKFYAQTYNVKSTFKIPRNKPTTVYRLPTIVAENEDKQVENICAAVMAWIQEMINVPARGPILIIAESIQKARKIKKKLQEAGHALMKANKKKVEKKNEETGEVTSEVTVESWSIHDSMDSGDVCAHLFPYYSRSHNSTLMEEFPDCSIVVASNKGGRGLDLKLDYDKCPHQPNGETCSLRHHHSTLDSKMGSVLFVILTEVLPGRQDEQAVGRCGRKGKAGVVQYLLAKRGDDSNPPSEPDAVYLERKNKKDAYEANDLSSKCNRIVQHCFDGHVLDTFCEYIGTYVREWMMKLFPRRKKKKKKKMKKIDDVANDEEDDGDRTILALKKVISDWFMEYCKQMWAYWRSYGGTRRGAGDARPTFLQRMSLVPPVDLTNSKIEKKKNPLQRLAMRFWTFSCRMRLSGEALYTFAKALLASDIDLPVKKWCIDLLKVASKPEHGVRLPPNANHKWQPEYTGNAALLLARLCEKPDQHQLKIVAIDRTIKAINGCIARYNCFKDLKKRTRAAIRSPNRKGTTYYHVQRAEIVKQLKERKKSLARLKNSNKIVLKHISDALKEKQNAHTAYCLCYGMCEVVFEWYVDRPFVDLRKDTKSWMNVRKGKAEKLGAGQWNTETKSQGGSGGGGGGSAEMKTEEQMNKSEKEGKSILSRLDAETEKQVETDSDNENGIPTYEWEPTAPTEDDIKLSKQTRTIWQALVGWLSFVWDWLVSLVTTAVRKYKLMTQSTVSVQDESTGEVHPIWEYVARKMAEQAKYQGMINGDLVSTYIGENALEIIEIVEELGPYLSHTDLYQEDVEIRTDGTTKEKTSRTEAKKQAKEEAEDQVHLRDESLVKEDMYLISNTLEELKKMAEDQQLEGFDDQFRKMLEAIAQYNEFAQDGKVDAETARRMNEAMKAMWKNLLRFALEHGSKIKNLHTVLDNYNICKTQSEFTEKVTEKVTEVTEFVKEVVTVVEKVVSYVWGWVKWIFGKVKKVVRKVKKVIKQIPVVREVTEWVTETIVNPVWEAANYFFSKAKKTLSTVFRGISKGFNSVYQLVKKFVKTVGNMASKAWDWVKEQMKSLKETWLWKKVSELLVKGFRYVAIAVIWAFVNVLKPTFEFCFWVVSWIWSNVIETILSWVAPQVLWTLELLKNLFGWIGRWIRYWWQGAGEIMENYVWGSEFDIIDVEKGNRITRFRMRVRAALRRVWSSSWLQWMLDKSIRLGLDIDERDHVHEEQSTAHSDYERDRRSKRQKASFAFAVIFVAFSILMLAAAFLTGGALLPASIGLIVSTLTALLQYASMDLERDMSVDEDSKRRIQNLISIAQSVVLISSLFFGGGVGGLFGLLKMIFEWGLRIEQKIKGVLEQVDKLFRMFGIGGASAVLMNIKKSLTSFLKNVMESVGNFLQVGKWIQSMTKKKKDSMEKEEEEEMLQQQEEEEEEEEEEESNDEDNVTKATVRKSDETFERDEWELGKSVRSVRVSSKGEESRRMDHQGDVLKYTFTPPDGGESITITVSKKWNEETKKLEVSFDRELTNEEKKALKELFGIGEEELSVELLEKLFQEASSNENITNRRSVQQETVTSFKEGKPVKREHFRTDEDGDVKVTEQNGKTTEVMVQPKDSEALYIDVEGTHSQTEKIWGGGVSEKHLNMLAKIHGSDKEAMDEFIENDLQDLVDLAKENKLEKERREEKKEEGYNDSTTEPEESEMSREAKEAARKAAGSGWKWVKEKYLSPIWAWIAKFWTLPLLWIESRLFVAIHIGRYIWNSWMSKTRLGKKLTSIANHMITKAQEFVRGVWNYGKGIMSRIAVRIGMKNEENSNEPAETTPEEDTEEATNEEDERKAALVERFFEALLPPRKQTEGEECVEQEPLETRLGKSFLKAFEDYSEVQDADFVRAVEVLVGKFSGDENEKMSNEEKEEFLGEVKRVGKAKALYDWLFSIAKKKKTSQGDDVDEQSMDDVVHEQMVRSGASYSRENMKFIEIGDDDLGDVSNVVYKLAQKLGVGEEGIQQNASAKQIQADLEKFIREGDQQGLCDYVEKLYRAKMPEEFAGMEMEEEWIRARDEEFQQIADKLYTLVTFAWGQVSDREVSRQTHDFAKMLSSSVCNLWVESRVEKLVEGAITKDKGMLIEKSESAYKVIESDGKVKLELDRNKLGELHEEHVVKILQRSGYEVIDVKLPRNNGIDILAVKKNADGDVVSILVVECKATTQEGKKSPTLTKTKTQGKQLSSEWIGEKMKQMYLQGGELREAAIMMRNNLDKIKPIVAFQKDGINSWSHQNKVPKFDQIMVEEILKDVWD